MGIGDQTELVILGDGARWVNQIAQTRYPKATLILDWWHLKHRVWETADYLKRNSPLTEQALKWGQELVSSLWCGETNKALTTIRQLSNENSIDLHPNVPSKDFSKRSLPEKADSGRSLTVSSCVGKWTHLVGTYDGKSIKLYVNDVLDGSKDKAGKAQCTRKTPVAIGGQFGGNAGTNELVNGIVDEACISSRALSEDEIRPNMTPEGLALDCHGKLAFTWGEIKWALD